MCHCCNRLSIKSKCNMGQKNSVPRDYMYFDFISNLYPTVCHISKFCFLCMPELHKVIFGNWIRRLRSVQPAGLLIFCGKKSKISRDFQGQIRGKIGQFRGIFAGKTSRNSQKNRPISLGFSGKKSNFEGFSGANSRKNWPISREISEGNFAKKQSIENNRFRRIFSGKFR